MAEVMSYHKCKNCRIVEQYTLYVDGEPTGLRLVCPAVGEELVITECIKDKYGDK